ncbi:hypothetical protein MJM59_33660, partial [Salmonella enterica subsp. enterica serovar Montevideo]|nr:hypothetical protein [Salmonella enterica subsp. enterica serovar Montevideo]
EAANREEAVQRMRDCLKNNKTELRLKILGLTTIPACIPEQITNVTPATSHRVLMMIFALMGAGGSLCSSTAQSGAFLTIARR